MADLGDIMQAVSTTVQVIRGTIAISKAACQAYESLKPDKYKDKLTPLYSYCKTVSLCLNGLQDCELSAPGIAALEEVKRNLHDVLDLMSRTGKKSVLQAPRLRQGLAACSAKLQDSLNLLPLVILMQVVKSNKPNAVSGQCPLLDDQSRQQAMVDIVRNLERFNVEVMNEEPLPSQPTRVAHGAEAKLKADPPPWAPVTPGTHVQGHLPLVIGIDLGTTNSCVATCDKDGTVKVLKHAGKLTTPSVVAYTATCKVVGQKAWMQMPENPKNTVYAAKRLIGRKYQDPSVQRDLMHLKWAPTIEEGEGGSILFKVMSMGQRIEEPPYAVSAAILQQLKEAAERELGQAVEGAVVSVPAYFSDLQRQATKQACRLANLKVLKLLQEPTAAILAYHNEELQYPEGSRTVLVFDLGGGTFDVSLGVLSSGEVDILAIAGDTHLGGSDFDALLRDNFVQVIKARCKRDIEQDPREMARLLRTCEKAKETLSSELECQLALDWADGGKPFEYRLKRKEFEKMCGGLVNRCMWSVQDVLDKAKKKRGDIDEVLLVGGMTRMPMVMERLDEMFPGKVHRGRLDPDLAVAEGAAVKAAHACGGRDWGVFDVAPRDFGVLISSGIVEAVIPRGTRLPASGTVNFTPVQDNATSVEFKVYEGAAGKTVSDNFLLGVFVVNHVVARPRGESLIAVTFRVGEEDGILRVSARDKTPGGQAKLDVTFSTS